jgi:toxin ParE1/3/4
MNVVWSRTALGHLTNIYEYIAQDSPSYARRMVDRITARSRQIAAFPESGQTVSEYGDPTVREVVEGSYRVIYQKRAEHLVVLSVIHGAQLLPREPPLGAGS